MFRRPKSKDRGLTIVNSKEQALAILRAEAAEGEQAVYKLKTPPGQWDDPMSRMQGFIRMATQQGVDAAQALTAVNTPEDMLMWTLLYGKMTDAQSANAWLKVSDQVFRRQQEVLKQINIEKQRGDKKEDRLSKARAALIEHAEKEPGE